MTPLPEGALAALAHRSRVLLCLDYDGTIAEIVDDPARATPHPEAPSLLDQYMVKPEPKLGGSPKETKQESEDK